MLPGPQFGPQKSLSAFIKGGKRRTTSLFYNPLPQKLALSYGKNVSFLQTLRYLQQKLFENHLKGCQTPLIYCIKQRSHFLWCGCNLHWSFSDCNATPADSLSVSDQPLLSTILKQSQTMFTSVNQERPQCLAHSRHSANVSQPRAGSLQHSLSLLSEGKTRMK